MSQWNDYAKGKGKLENIFDIEDYYLKQKGMRDSKKYKVDKKYWLSKLDDFPAAPNLKLRQNVRDVKAKNFKRIQEIIDRKTYNEICEITAKNNVSPSIAFITAYAYILGFWSNQKNLSINLTTMDRPTGIDAKNAIGEFTKIVLLDSSVDATKSFWENAKMIQRRLLGGLGHRSYDGIEFIRDLMRESDTPSGSIMPVVFTSMLYGDKNLTVDALGEIKYSISQTSQVYLDAQISETKNGIVLNWDYMAELFDSEMIKKMFRQYIALVKSIMDENLQYPEISKNDKKTINTYNQTQTDIPETTIQDMFKLIAKAYSDILKFAEKKKNIKIFHISTKHVGFGSVPDKKDVLFSESEFNVGQVIDNNYAKTKYEAETLMRAARDEGYNINIFRMGNISCELKGGKFQKNIEQNAFYILTRSFLRLGILPLSEQKTVDLTYVDSAARAIYLLATRKNLNNETYHIENTELLSFTHMGKMIQKYGENVVLRPYEDMWDYFLPIYEEGTDNSKMQEINNLIAYIDFLPWHMPTMFRFVKDKTKILLEKMGFAWKEPDQEIIDNLLDYGKQVGFFD